jgi:trk system potassium uptake protein TrkA
MNIIICGAGRVGSSISSQLSKQGHSVTVIDKSSEDIQKINDSQDAKGIVGIATYPSILEKADAKNTDMIIAVTRNDETNMVVCQIAHSLFNVTRKIARIRSKEFLKPIWKGLFTKENLPIDIIISPEFEVAKSLYRKLEAPGSIDNIPFADDAVRLLEIIIDEKCPVINTSLSKLSEIFSDLQANVLGVLRNDKFTIFKKTDKLLKDDKAFVLTNSKQVDRRPRIKIIEKNKERAETIASELNETIVIKGDCLDESLLKEINIDEIDTVLSLTDDDEVNIMSALLCKKKGVRRTIAIANSSNYSLLQSSLKIDDIVDPRMTTVSTILKHVHKGKIESVYTLDNGDYEVIEAKILESSELLNQKLSKAKIPDGIKIGLVVRDRRVFVPTKETVFNLNDTVILLSSRENLTKIEELFKISPYF